MVGAQKLSSLDASFLHLETRNTHMHIGGIAVFEASPLGSGEVLYDGIVRAIEPRLDLMPRYRQKIALVPLSLDTPVWIDDPDFDIKNHVLHAALPKPGGDKQLREFAGRVFSRPLDRRRPLWELYIIEGLRDGRWALLTKTHHAMVDGISNLELATILLDTDPDAPETLEGSRWQPEDAPTATGLLINSLRERLARPARLLSAARAVASQPRRMGAALRDTASGVAAMAETMRVPKSIINGKTGTTRGYAFSRFPLEDFRLVKTAFEATINDTVLAAVAGGLRHYLIKHGVDPDDPDEALQALCPVSIRDASERTALGNRLAMLLVKLPIDEPSPDLRMVRVRQVVDRLKARKQAVGADFLLNLAGFAPATLHAMVARASLRSIGFNLVVTNVPGPQFPLYCRGARLVEAFPIAFLYEGQLVSIAIFSYLGWLNFGYLSDALGLPDVDVFAKCVEKGFAELVSAARKRAEVATIVELPARATKPRRSRRPVAPRRRSTARR
jgi:diacylglycerol O-acyltransferase